jgi:steroid 5-alpha reductase family enzyme
MFVFFFWREYISWPALHQKVVELQSKMTIPFTSKLLCWLVYSFVYTCMVAPCWCRLASHHQTRWGVLGYTGIFFQIVGLLLETIADLQKSGFKSQKRHRNSFCNVGVWKWSTHPNYLGEGLFWWGTYMAHGLGSAPIMYSLLSTVGLVFITLVLQGSTRSLTRKHMEKYGDQPEFYEFQRTHAIWGSKHWLWWLQGMEEFSTGAAAVATTPEMRPLNSTMPISMMEDPATNTTTNATTTIQY